MSTSLERPKYSRLKDVEILQELDEAIEDDETILAGGVPTSTLSDRLNYDQSAMRRRMKELRDRDLIEETYGISDHGPVYTYLPAGGDGEC